MPDDTPSERLGSPVTSSSSEGEGDRVGEGGALEEPAPLERLFPPRARRPTLAAMVVVQPTSAFPTGRHAERVFCIFQTCGSYFVRKGVSAPWASLF